MNIDFNAMGQALVDLLKQNAVDLGIELKGDLKGAADVAATKMQELQAALGEPGYNRALEAAADSVVCKLADRAIDRGDAIDARLQAMAQGALGIVASGLKTVAAG